MKGDIVIVVTGCWPSSHHPKHESVDFAIYSSVQASLWSLSLYLSGMVPAIEPWVIVVCHAVCSVVVLLWPP